MTQTRFRTKITPYVFLLPLAVSIGFLIYNLAINLYESTQHHLLAYPKDIRFIGLENFSAILHNVLTELLLKNSLVWVIGTTVPTFFLGFTLALLLNQKFTGRRLYRVMVLSPWAVSGVVSCLMWSWILNGPFGVLNDTLVRLGFMTVRTPWLANPDTAMAGVVMSSVWRGLPFFAITLLAGLQSIPVEVYEAANIDGANAPQRFLYVTLPFLKNLIILTTLLRAVWSFNYIENIFLMTYGGPANSTSTWAFHIFQRFYDAGDIGYTAAMSVLTLIFLVTFTVIYLRISRSTQVDIV